MQQSIDDLTGAIIGAAIRVHTKYGPGLLESVYNAALGQELVLLGHDVHIGKPISLDHEGLHINRAYVLDLLVDDRVIVELKCVRKITDVDVAQLLTYLRLMNIRVGLIINFNVVKRKHGIRRVVNRHVDDGGRRLSISSPAGTAQEIKETLDAEPDDIKASREGLCASRRTEPPRPPPHRSAT